MPKRTGVTLETSLSEMWFFICTVRSLDRMVSGDYGKGSRVWVSELDSPGFECCFFYGLAA